MEDKQETQERGSLLASRESVPRATVETVIPDLAPEHREIVEKYLGQYIDPTFNESGRCPDCGQGGFTWSIAWGQGHCFNCSWPATLYHAVTDRSDDPSLVCSATCNGHRVCTATQGEHEAVTRHWYVMDGPNKGQSEDRIHLMCPNPEKPPGLRHPFTSEYRPPEVARFNLILWVHPDFVEPKA